MEKELEIYLIRQQCRSRQLGSTQRIILDFSTIHGTIRLYLAAIHLAP
jgi:hypothetical protein